MLVKKQGGATALPTYKKPTTNGKPAFVSAPQLSEDAFASIPDVSEPVASLSESSLLFYGERKIGKTAVAAEFPNALFFMFEPGGEGLRIRPWTILTWDQMLRAIKTLEQNPKKYTSVVDTCDKAYEMAYDFTCKKMHIQSPGDADYGDGWKAIQKEYNNALARIMAASRGTIFISHADVSEFQKADGIKYSKLIPTMGKQARRFVVGTASTLLYFGYYGEDRFMTITGSDSLEAGTRLKEQFWLAGKEGVDRVHSIPMGSSPEEAFRNLELAFGNKQKTSGRPSGRTGLSETPVKRPGRR